MNLNDKFRFNVPREDFLSTRNEIKAIVGFSLGKRWKKNLPENFPRDYAKEIK